MTYDITDQGIRFHIPEQAQTEPPAAPFRWTDGLLADSTQADDQAIDDRAALEVVKREAAKIDEIAAQYCECLRLGKARLCGACGLPPRWRAA